MVEELRKIASDLGNNAFLGDAEVRALRKRFDSLTDDDDAPRRWRVVHALGTGELRLGQVDPAIEHLRIADELLPQLVGEITNDQAYFTKLNLGLAYMVWGERLNCVAMHTSHSCILPIERPGVHVDRRGSENAVRVFDEILELFPGDLAAVWLLNIAHMTLGSYPHGVPEVHRLPRSVFASEQAFPRFYDVAPGLGVNAFDLAGGVVVDDLDGDLDLDIVSSTWDPAGEMHVFQNQGDGRFEDRTTASGLSGLTGGINMVQADYDNDGDVDLFVMRGGWFGEHGHHPNSLLRNDGDGKFEDVTFDAGLAEAYPTHSAGWADFDLDGDLDLYVGNEAWPGHPNPSQLFRNDGDGTFTDVAEQAGVQNLSYAKGVTWGDYDGDRYPDLYVSNWRHRNRLYHNNGDGTFTDVAERSGVAEPLVSFPCWFWDYDNDGALDLMVLTYCESLKKVAASYLGRPSDAELHRLYRGDGKGGFEEVGQQCNLRRLSVVMGSNFGDLDNDGFLDMYLGTGSPPYESLMPNVMYRNDRGRRFVDVTTAGGFGHLQKGHAIAFADLDGDGDQDVYQQMGGAYPGDGFGNTLFENPGFGHHWLKLRLVGQESNRSAIGARIHVQVRDEQRLRSIYKHVNSGGSFGANPLRQEIGLGPATNIERLEIYWPASNRTQTFRDVNVDVFLEIVEGDPTPRALPIESARFATER